MALNDGKAAALAELATGHLQGVTNGAALVLGSGLGGGLIINGKLFFKEVTFKRASWTFYFTSSNGKS